MKTSLVILLCLVGIGIIPLSGQEVVDSTVRYFKYNDENGIHHRRCITRMILPESVPEKLTPRGVQSVDWEGISFEFPGIQQFDTLIISAQPEKLQELKSIQLFQNDSLLTTVYLFMEDTIVIPADGDLNLVVKSKRWPWFIKKYANLEVIRIPAVQIDTQYQIYDTTFYVQTEFEALPRDTAWLTIADFQVTAGSTLNIESSPIAIQKITVPLEVEDVGGLQFAGIWLGVGQEALPAYDLLEASITEGAPPGVPAALGAYSLGIQKTLPDFCVEDVLFSFLDSLQVPLFGEYVRAKQQWDRVKWDTENPTPEPQPAYDDALLLPGPNCYYTVLGRSDFPSFTGNSATTIDLFLTVGNFNTVDAVPVSLKMIGCYISPPTFSSTDQLVIKEINVYQKPCE